jgi:hypothetical protein
MPTLAELVGASSAVPADIDGISLVPTLLNQGTQQPREGLYWERFPSDNANAAPIQVGRIGDWKLIRQSSGSLELYHLATDPSESSNVAGNPANAAILNQLVSFIDANHLPPRPQISVHPPDVGNGPGTRDGIVAFGRRPVPFSRDWHADIAGDARFLETALVDPLGETVVFHLDDAHFDYELDLTIERTGPGAPLLEVELIGDSGFVYFGSSYDIAQLDPGSNVDVSLPLDLTGTTPNSGDAASDLNRILTLRVSHTGNAGQVLVDNLRLRVPGIPLFGDLDQSGILDVGDWLLFRANLFSDLTGLTAWDAYWQGDLNSDGFNNEFDFDLFKRAYEFRYGAGSFAELLQVPEPTSALSWCLAIAMALDARRRASAGGR